MSRYWKIGQLAGETGLTVRTLRHYDEIGLLTPSERSDSGYRLYGPEDIARLQQIVSLKELGFSLEKIKVLLDTQEYTPQEIVRMHLEQVKEQIEWEQKLCAQLERVAKAIDQMSEVTTEDLIRIAKVINMMETHNFDPGFTHEEEEKLKTRREELGDEKIREVEQEWPELIAKVRAHMESGTPPDDPEVQKLAQRWQELVLMFTGGDSEIGRKVKEAYDNSPGFTADMGMGPELFEYVEKALGKKMA